MGMPTVIFGTNPRDGKLFIDHSVDSFAAYCGAVKGQDGWGGHNVSFGNLIRATGEINEAIFPVRHLARDYETDSGGAGRSSRWQLPAASTGSRCCARRRSTRTSLASPVTQCQGHRAARTARPNKLMVRVAAARSSTRWSEKAGYIEHTALASRPSTTTVRGGWVGRPLERPPEASWDDVLTSTFRSRAPPADYGVA
jgi:N-methylhydantoinase B/oxoprolinase/acetone carboxylase alpha subunit